MDLGFRESKIMKDDSFKREHFSSLQEIILAKYVCSQEMFYYKQFEEVVERILQKGVTQTFSVKSTPAGSFHSGRSGVKLAVGARLDGITSLNSAPSPAFSMSSLNNTITSRRATILDFPQLKVNIRTKIDLIDKEIYANKTTKDRMKKKFNSADFLLKTEEENLRAELEEIDKMKSLLSDFVIRNMDETKKQIEHNKFSKFLANELENTNSKWKRIRLQNKTLEIDFNRVKKQQQIKLELGSNINSIDIDRLDIENKKYHEILEQRLNNLNHSKKVVARKGQTLISIKSKLNETIDALTKIRRNKKGKEAKLALIEKKEIHDENKLKTAELSYGNIRRLHDNYKCADVSQYMKTEAALSEAKKEKAYWEKRFLNTKQTMMLLENQARKITPLSKSLRKTKSDMSKLRTPA